MGSTEESFDETSSFWWNFTFTAIFRPPRVDGTCVFFRARKWAKIAIFLILPDPGCPRDPKVESHTDPVVSWDTVGGIRALVCPQGPLQADFGATKKRCLRRRAHLAAGPTQGGGGQDKKKKSGKS